MMLSIVFSILSRLTQLHLAGWAVRLKHCKVMSRGQLGRAVEYSSDPICDAQPAATMASVEIMIAIRLVSICRMSNRLQKKGQSPF